jgi:clorobiocin biosynthesis protein CloN2
MRIQDTYLTGIGAFLPPVTPVAEAVARGLIPPGEAQDSGISGVSIAGQLPAPQMALTAATEALKHSGRGAEDIGLLLCAGVWHQGPDGWGPQYYLQRHLLGDDLLAVEVRHGCNGVFSALELAVPYLHADPRQRGAVVTAADNFGSALIDRWSSGESRVYLGDGAGAVVLGRTPGFAQLLSICTTTYSAMEEVHRAGEPLFPPGATAGTVLDFGARAQRFQEQAIERGDWIRLLLGHQRHNVECTAQALDEAGVTADEINRVLIHAMPRQAASSYLKILGFPLNRSTWNFSRTVGHLGAADHLVALHHLLTEGELKPGDNLLLCGYSPGLTYKAAVVRILDVPATGAGRSLPDGL